MSTDAPASGVSPAGAPASPTAAPLSPTGAPASPFTLRDGAVGSPVPEHYGSPTREQRELAAGRAIVDLSSRGVVAVTGPDRLTWLDSLTSQSLTHLAPGESTETLQLDPNGHLEHAAGVLDDGVTAWLLVDAGEATALLDWLSRMRFRSRVELRDASAELATIGWFDRSVDASASTHPAGSTQGDGFTQRAGERESTLAVPAAAPNGVPLTWRDPWSAPTGHSYSTAQPHPSAEWRFVASLVPRDRLAELAALPAAGTLALEALRIAAWRPRLSAESDERSIPHELDWLRTAVSLGKGCYRGQETVAKVHNLGHPPRRLVMLHLDGSDGVLPAPGAAVLDGEAEVGRVTSSALHFELGPIALAVVKRRTPVDATLTVRADDVSVAAAQEVVVPPDAGAVVDVPRLPRLGSVRR